MATHKSAEKRARQSIVRTARNSQSKNTVRTFEKKVRAAIATGDKALATSSLKELQSKLAKAAAKGIVHARSASRKISRLSTGVSGLR